MDAQEHINYRPFARLGPDEMPYGFYSEIRVAAQVIREGSRMTPETSLDGDILKGWEVSRIIKQSVGSEAPRINETSDLRVEILFFETQEEAMAAAEDMFKNPATLDDITARKNKLSELPQDQTRHQFFDVWIDQIKAQQEIAAVQQKNMHSVPDGENPSEHWMNLVNYRDTVATINNDYQESLHKSKVGNLLMTTVGPALAYAGVTAAGLAVDAPTALAGVAIVGAIAAKSYFDERKKSVLNRDHQLEQAKDEYFPYGTPKHLEKAVAFSDMENGFKVPLSLKDMAFNAYSDLADKINLKRNVFTKAFSFVKEIRDRAEMGASLFQSKYETGQAPVAKGLKSSEDQQNIEKMAASMAKLRDACVEAVKSGNRFERFGANKLSANLDDAIKDAVVNLRQNGNHKIIFDKIATQMDALTGYGHSLLQKGGLSEKESAELILNVASAAEALGADKASMRYSRERAEKHLDTKNYQEASMN